MPVKIDIIILSYAKTAALKQTTLDCVESLAASEMPGEIVFETLVIESNRQMQPYQYPGAKTIYPDTAFGYHKYMNIGINATNNPYICLCNNDLIFHKGWASEILKAFNKNGKILSANPFGGPSFYSEKVVTGKDIILRSENPNLDGVLTGWCIFVKREIFKIIGLLDEQFEFWYADTDYDLTLKKYNVEHALVKTSFVEHIAMQSHDLLSDKEKFTFGQKEKFTQKWGNQSRVQKLISRTKTFIKSHILNR